MLNSLPMSSACFKMKAADSPESRLAQGHPAAPCVLQTAWLKLGERNQHEQMTQLKADEHLPYAKGGTVDQQQLICV